MYILGRHSVRASWPDSQILGRINEGTLGQEILAGCCGGGKQWLHKRKFAGKVQLLPAGKSSRLWWMYVRTPIHNTYPLHQTIKFGDTQRGFRSEPDGKDFSVSEKVLRKALDERIRPPKPKPKPTYDVPLRPDGLYDNTLLSQHILSIDDIDDLSRLCSRERRNFDAVNVGTAFNRLGILCQQQHHAKEEAVQAAKNLAKAAITLWDKLMSHELTMILVAHVRLGLTPSEELLQALNARALDIMDDFQPEGIAGTLWSFSKLAIRPPAELTAAIGKMVVLTIDRFGGSDLSRLMRSYAHLELSPGGDVIRALLKRSMEKARGLSATHLANILWATASMKIAPGDTWVNAMRDRASVAVQDMEASEISSIVWAFTAMERDLGKDLFLRMCRKAFNTPKQLTPHRVCSILSYFVQQAVPPDREILSRLCMRLAQDTYILDPPQLATILSSLAALEFVPDAELCGRLQSAVYAQIDEFEESDAEKVLEAFHELGIKPNLKKERKEVLVLAVVHAVASLVVMNNCMRTPKIHGIRGRVSLWRLVCKPCRAPCHASRICVCTNRCISVVRVRVPSK
jgi:hypothetical protein